MNKTGKYFLLKVIIFCIVGNSKFTIFPYHFPEIIFQIFDSIQHYVIKFVSDLRQVTGFLRYSTNNTDRHDIAEVLLKVALNTTNQIVDTLNAFNVLVFPNWHGCNLIFVKFIHIFLRCFLKIQFVMSKLQPCQFVWLLQILQVYYKIYLEFLTPGTTSY